MTKRKNDKTTRFKFLINPPENKTQLIYEITRILIGLVFGAVAFSFAHFLLFLDTPFLGVPYVGEVLISVTAFSVVYYLIPPLLKAVAEGIRNIINQQLYESINLLNNSGNKNKKPKIKKEYVKPVLLDTSVLIDGRFCSVIKEGFVSSQIIVPQFVIDELQGLADSKTKITRDKGRRGLSILQDIKKIKKKEFIVYPTKNTKDVDKALVSLAKRLKGRVATVDYNLNKVAKVLGVKVLNVNSLANALKISVIPGDTITVEIKKTGSNKNQGVGYMFDGTMVVVDGGKDHINKHINCEVEKVLQKDSGQMIFAKYVQVKSSAVKK